MRLFYVFLAIFAALACLGKAADAHSARCFDLRKSEPAALEGKLISIIFAGPPNYADVRTGDTPESAFVLRLPHPICLQGDDFADPNTLFSDVQLVATDATARAMRTLLNLKVHVTLTQQMAAETGHHHEPLVAWVSQIHEIGDYTSMDDFISEYGTAATVIRAFYYALGNGEGLTASRYIVPEKRMKHNFSPDSLSRFYGPLIEPLQLLSIKASDSSTYLVHYRFRSKSRRCDGEAIVNTTMRGANNYIAKITALNGC